MSYISAFQSIDPNLKKKYHTLQDRISSLESVVVAFSGGVDSSLLAVIAHQVLAPNMLAVTIRSEVEIGAVMETAQALATQFGFPHQIIEYKKLKDDDYVENTHDRCYVCKTVDLFLITEIAKKAGIKYVLIGANTEDLGDYRPGLRAAKEYGAISPLAEIGFTKQDVRDLARALGLGNWNHPSSPCLASRIPYGTKVTKEKLEQVAAGEAYLRALNFHIVRVRNNEGLARIEVPTSDIPRLVSLRDEVAGYFRQIGFHYITVDLEGFRSGSLNEILKHNKNKIPASTTLSSQS